MVVPFALAANADLAAQVRELGWTLDACPQVSWTAGNSHDAAAELLSLSNWDRASAIDVAQWMLRRRHVAIAAAQSALRSDAVLHGSLVSQWNRTKRELPAPLAELCGVNWTYSGDKSYDSLAVYGERALWVGPTDAYRSAHDTTNARRIETCPRELLLFTKLLVAPPPPPPKATIVAAAPTFPYRPKSVRQY